VSTTDGNLGVTLATFLFLLRRSGRPLADAAIDAACARLDSASGAPAALGAALVAAVEPHLAAGNDAVLPALRAIVGEDHVRADLGEGADRDARTTAIRRAHFGQRLPWLAEIADRLPDGSIGRHWVLVEAFDEVARVMDPNPWDDRDEERAIPVGDFMVLWELAGLRSIRIDGPPAAATSPESRDPA
jgi:hypothetical protein